MNLALHGFLLQVIASLVDFQHGFRLCSAGEPGYLDFDNLPETNFSCQGKVIGGYYADVEAGCQMFHVCTIGQKDEIMDIKFLCLNGTVFDQETRVCERVDEVDCSKSERFYNLNLELYGNNAVTLSLHDNNDDDGEPTEPIDDHQQHTTSGRPSTTTTTSTTTTEPPTTPTPYQHPTGYPHHFQPQPPFPTSQSKLHYDDKNGGFHHQYIFHNGERPNTNQATSYQLFSNQGIGSSTGVPPQIHQIRFSSTPNPQIIHNEPPTIAPIFRASSSTIQTLLNSNANNPALINPLFHNHGIASTTEQFSVHNNNPRETSEYQDEDQDEDENEDDDNDDDEEDHEEENDGRIPLEAIQPTNKGKVSKLTVAPVPPQHLVRQSSPTKSTQDSQQHEKISNFQPTPTPIEPTVRSFYPTPRTSPKPQSTPVRVPQHIHVPPPPSIPQLKPHQITINLPPPDIQRIVQNPSPLLPSQSRVIVTAKASVSDESGRPLNTTQLVTLPLPTIPASYDDYKEGDESFDPFYRDVPKIRNARRAYEHLGAYILGASLSRRDSFVRSKREVMKDYGDYDYDEENRDKLARNLEPEDSFDESLLDDTTEITDLEAIKANLKKFKAILLGRRGFTDSIEERSRNLSTKRSEPDVLNGGVKSSKIVGSKMVDDTDEQFDDDDDDDDDDGGAFERNTKVNESEALSVTKAFDAEIKSNLNTERTDVEESVDRKVASNNRESDAEKDSKSKLASNNKKSNAEDDLEAKSTRSYVPENTGRKSTLNTKISDVEEYIESKSQLNSKESDAEEYVEHEFDTKMVKLDAEDFVKSKSVLDSKESDVEEYVESNPVLNSKESDAEEYVEIKSALNTKESDAEEYVESNPVLNSKESDAEEYVEIKSALKTKESDAEEQVELESALNKESDAEEYLNNKSAFSSENTNVDEHVTVKYNSSVKMTNTAVNRKIGSVDQKVDDEVINPKSLNTKGPDAEESIERKSSTNSKESDLEEYVEPQSILNTKDLSTEPNFISNTKKSDTEEYTKTESSLDDMESDVDELFELKFSTTTEGPDTEEYVEFKSILNTKKSDSEEYIEPKSTSKKNKSNNDAAESTERKHIPNTKISDIVGNVEPEYTENIKTTDVADDAEDKSALNSRESDVTEYMEPKSVSNAKDSETEKHTKIDKSIFTSENTKKSVKLESEEKSDSEGSTEGEENYANRETGKAISKNVEETRDEKNGKTSSKKSEANSVTRDSKKVEGAKTSDSHLRPGAPKLKYPTRRPLLASPMSRKFESAKDGGQKSDRAQSKSKVANKSTNSLNSETEEQIDSQIFEEPESQTSKEVDTRAVAQHESKVSKSLSKSDVSGKEGRNNLIKTPKMRPNIPGSKKERPFEEKPKSEMKISKKDEMEDLVEDDEVSTTKEEKLEASVEQAMPFNDEDYVSEENASNDYESRQHSEEYSEDKSDESPNKIASDETGNNSREENEEKEEEASSSVEDPSHREDKSMMSANKEDEDYEGEYGSQESSSPPKTSEEAGSVEYSNSNDASFGDSREIDSDYDYVDSQSHEDATTSAEYVGSKEEVTNSQEESAFTENNEPMPSDETDKMDVLKFTDELPHTEKKEDASNEEKVESGKDIMEDYIDDNYEPVHYKEGMKKNKKEKVEKEKKLTSSVDLDDKIVKDKVDDYVNDNDEPTHYMEKEMKNTKKPFSSKDLKDEKKEVNGELELSEEKQKYEKKEEDKRERNDESKSAEKERREDDEAARESTSEEGDAKTDRSFEVEEEEEEEDEDSTTTSTTTTTPRPTPPKLFKPISARKSYNFIPPTSTPNPVVIKPRFGLFNPKPSKPQKTYSDMAPKPTIRKHPLLARKTSTTIGTTTVKSEQTQKRLNDIENSSEIVSTSTETGTSEENILDSKTEFTDQKKSSVDHSAETQPLETAPLLKSKDDQILSASIEDVPNTSIESDEVSTVDVETMIITSTPYSSSRTSTIARDPEEDQKFGINAIPDAKKISTTEGIVSSTIEATTAKPVESSISVRPEVTLLPPEPGPDLSHSSTVDSKLEVTSEVNSHESETISSPELTSVRSTGRKSTPTKRQATFNCFEKEMYRFYGDTRDCRLFHYCSPGFTSRQVLDFRFVCEEGTVFDEESQSCRHDVKSTKCVNRPW